MLTLALLALLTLPRSAADPHAPSVAAASGAYARAAYARASPAETLHLKDALEALAAAHAAHDPEAARALFRRAPHWAALVVAADLESALALREGGAPAERVEQLCERARWAGRAAAEADLALVGEWAAAISDLDEQGLRRYRQGQARFASALALADQPAEQQRALELVISACDHALSVGDWWGVEQTLRERTELERGMSAFEEALVSCSRARQVSRALGLVADELDCVVTAAELAGALELDRRALELVRQAFELRERLVALGVERGADAGERERLLRLRASLEARAGDAQAAEATRRELEGAGGR